MALLILDVNPQRVIGRPHSLFMVFGPNIKKEDILKAVVLSPWITMLSTKLVGIR